ncbi:DOPA 4,5-dioxygenase family protein [Microcoleus sp. S36b_A3]|uniref:DOPA 4,5-dioxygenase family protein n=1 Tax=unclassified Microcoleus TaxID=2642155 RepID=UPI002FD49A61
MKADTIEIVGFHAHIYFDSDSRDAAARVREGLAQFEVQLGRWHDKPIGPHPQAMYQVAFLPPQFGKVVPWLMLHREGLDILVHPETGDGLWLRPAPAAIHSASVKHRISKRFPNLSIISLIRLISTISIP